MPKTIKILPATPSDIPTLVDIFMSSTRHNPFFVSCFPDCSSVKGWFVDMLTKELAEEEGARFLVAVDDCYYTSGSSRSGSGSGSGSERTQYAKQQEEEDDDGHGHDDYNDDDDDDDDDGKRGMIIAFAKWVWVCKKKKEEEDIKSEEQDPPPPPTTWPPETNKELATNFFAQLAKKHKAIMESRAGSGSGSGSRSGSTEEMMGKKKKKEEGHWYLEMLFTHPRHQRRGLGSLLMAGILEAADRDDHEAYLESSPDGNALYQKMGFEMVDRVVVSVPVVGGDNNNNNNNNNEQEDMVQYTTDLMVRRVRNQVGI